METVFCRVTAGVWMSRSSLVWGPFSVVWGLALVLATVLLRQEKDRSDRYLFAFGTVMGGVYEYVCSAVTELLFGTVFWDYSKFKFNLGGRINLLYCFFWGNAAAQGIGACFQFLVQLFQHRVLRRISSHQHRRAQLIQRRNAKRDPYQRMQQPVRHKSTQPQQQPVAPQHSHHAQRRGVDEPFQLGVGAL